MENKYNSLFNYDFNEKFSCHDIYIHETWQWCVARFSPTEKMFLNMTDMRHLFDPVIFFFHLMEFHLSEKVLLNYLTWNTMKNLLK